MSRETVSTLCAVFVFGLFVAGVTGALAQPADAPESPNVGHTRHHHPHNPRHPAAADPARFFTDRESPVVLPLPEEDDAYFFVVFGDRTGGPDGGVSVLADAVRDTNLLEPDLVMTVGDLIQGYNESPEWLIQKNEFKAVMDNLLCPWFPVAGNHDVYWRDRDGGEAKPNGEHEANYEMHFGPLWYSFRHKSSEFIVLYSDEGDPETGIKNFRRPESQKMSPEQRAFLQAALDRGRDAEHVFVFLHHPRWLKGGYGDDWDSVHEMLVSAGNVSAVFAGHIHRMRYEGVQDGIEYFTLATVGGHQRGTVPEAGYRHHFQVVTVRAGQIATASVPVDSLMDPRDITGTLSVESAQLAALVPQAGAPLSMASDGSVGGVVGVEIANPTSFEVDYTLSPDSQDAWWSFAPDHAHGILAPGETRTVSFRIDRLAAPLDRTFRAVEFVLDRELLTKSFRYTVPTTRHEVSMDLAQLRPARPAAESVLRVRDGGVAMVDSGLVELPDGPMTVECWFNADRFGERVGLIAKTESSDYGIFVSNGRPEFSVHLGGGYATAEASGQVLRPGNWHHIAGVFDGREVRLYVDGSLVARASGAGERRTNTLPLVIGADVDGSGNPTSPFDGAIDEVRLSSAAKYSGDSFTPARRLHADADTVMWLPMDGMIGPWLYDHAGRGAHGRLRGGAALETP